MTGSVKQISIQGLFVYPIKSMGSVAVERLDFGEFGVRNDRQYMLVNEKGRFITQRSHPVLSQFHLKRDPKGWEVDFSGKSIVIPDEDSTERLINTQVWKSPIKAREKSADVSAWFSDCLDEWVMLVEMDDLERRTKTVDGQPSALAFADGYPLLVCNQQSLNALNQELNSNLSMQRFRPNIVIDMPSQSEYDQQRLELNRQQFIALSIPCERCNIPAIDPDNGVFSRSVHDALSQQLRRDGKVVFGVNAAPMGMSHLSISDTLTPRHL